MLAKLDDLLFVIGLFLSLIGAVVFGAYLFGGDDLVQNIHVNRLGGSLLLFIGAGMIGLSYWNDRATAKKAEPALAVK